MLFFADVTLQEEVQEGTLNPTCGQESFRNQENILRPIHPPLIININHQEDEEEDEEDVEDKENSKQVLFFFCLFVLQGSTVDFFQLLKYSS